MPTSPDSELVLRLLADDVAAFDSLYNRYSRSLYANIRKLTRDNEVAQDILQDVFIALWEKRQTIDASQPIASWLFALSFYKSLAYLKKTLKEQVLIKDIAHKHRADSDNEEEIRENRIAHVEKAILQLSPQKQKVLIRCKLAGKTYKEVAEELSISRHTVKEYLSLAITSLRALLK